eukprot:5911176-Prorocentrum_lima.AAC.1
MDVDLRQYVTEDVVELSRSLLVRARAQQRPIRRRGRRGLGLSQRAQIVALSRKGFRPLEIYCLCPFVKSKQTIYNILR